MSLPFKFEQPAFKFGDLFPDPQSAHIHCDFCRCEPTRIELKIYEDAEIDHLLIVNGWSILGGKEMCPECAEGLLKKIQDQEKNPEAKWI